MGQVDLFSERNWIEVSRLYSFPYNVDTACLHHAVEQQVRTQPDRVAVESSDGCLTYLELDQMANAVAHQLVERGAGPEVVVSFCFDKRPWAIVAMLAILKAGSACIALEPSYPRKRAETLIHDTKSTIVLTTPAFEQYMIDIGMQPILVNSDTFVSLPPATCPPETDVQPDNAAFIVATSGSTGTPKCAVLEHRNLSTFTHNLRRMGMINSSRVGQFSAYSFDASIMDTILALTQGACICILSEEERLNHLSEAMTRLKVTWCFLTPTVIRMLEPQHVPHLETIVSGGERLPDDLISKWGDALNLIK